MTPDGPVVGVLRWPGLTSNPLIDCPLLRLRPRKIADLPGTATGVLPS